MRPLVRRLSVRLPYWTPLCRPSRFFPAPSHSFATGPKPSSSVKKPAPTPINAEHKALADELAQTDLQLQSEEIQKLLKVVDLYLAGGKQQREAVLRALERESSELKEQFLQLVPKVIEQRGFIIDRLASAADVTQQPVSIPRLLASDTKPITPRQVLNGVMAPPVGRAARIVNQWLQELQNVDLNSTHGNDAWEFERAFEAVRDWTIKAYPRLVNSALTELAAEGKIVTTGGDAKQHKLLFLIEAAHTFAPYVSEKLYALALFGMKSSITQKELQAAADDPCDSKARAKLVDPFRLATVADLHEAYGIEATKVRKDLHDRDRRFPAAQVLDRLRKNKLTDVEPWEATELQHWLPSWETCTIYAKTAISGPTRSHEFHKYMTQSNQHDFLTAEMLSSLAQYICERMLLYKPQLQQQWRDIEANKQSIPAKKQINIVEVGCGNGRLTHFLRKYIDKTIRVNEYFLPPVRIFATDPNPPNVEVEPVEKLDCDAALKKYAPTIVISEWMPSGVDFSESFRRCPSVKEYIMLGEVDTSICGDLWRTWGKKGYDSLGHLGAGRTQTPPYEAEGFQRVDVPAVSEKMICKNDNFYSVGWSKCVSFRRK